MPPKENPEEKRLLSAAFLVEATIEKPKKKNYERNFCGWSVKGLEGGKNLLFDHFLNGRCSQSKALVPTALLEDIQSARPSLPPPRELPPVPPGSPMLAVQACLPPPKESSPATPSARKRPKAAVESEKSAQSKLPCRSTRLRPMGAPRPERGLSPSVTPPHLVEPLPPKKKENKQMNKIHKLR